MIKKKKKLTLAHPGWVGARSYDALYSVQDNAGCVLQAWVVLSTSGMLKHQNKAFNAFWEACPKK